MDKEKELYCPFCGLRLRLYDLGMNGKPRYICDTCGHLTDEETNKKWFSDDEDEEEDDDGLLLIADEEEFEEKEWFFDGQDVEEV